MQPARPLAARVTLVLTATLAIILAFTLGLALMSPADAAGKPQHHLRHLRGHEVGTSNSFYIDGRVPTFKKGSIKVLRNVSGGKYAVWKTTRTSGKGAFRTAIVQVGRQRTCYKIQVPATDAYRRTTSDVIGCIESD